MPAVQEIEDAVGENDAALDAEPEGAGGVTSQDLAFGSQYSSVAEGVKVK